MHSLKVFIVSVGFFSPLGIASTKVNNCFPESSKRYPISTFKSLGMNEVEFNQIIQTFSSKLQNYVFDTSGKTLSLVGDWKSERANAYITRDMEDNPKIVLNGGMARHPKMTRDGLYLVLCHELGHYFGGAPKSFRGNTTRRSWSSAEGQADYFASNKCLPLLINELNDGYDYSFVRSNNEKEECQTGVCSRIRLAGLSVANVFASLKNSAKPELDKKDTSVVYNTNYGHPSPQCRLDTFLAGAVCGQTEFDEVDNSDPKIGSCVRGSKLDLLNKGARPLCWFNPLKF